MEANSAKEMMEKNSETGRENPVNDDSVVVE